MKGTDSFATLKSLTLTTLFGFTVDFFAAFFDFAIIITPLQHLYKTIMTENKNKHKYYDKNSFAIIYL